MKKEKLIEFIVASFMGGLILLSLFPATAFPEELKVRVIVRRANIRAEADIRSEIIGKARRGEVLRVEEKEGEWYQIRLPLKIKGYELVGYIHESIVQEVGEEKNLPQEEIASFDEGYEEEQKFGLGFTAGYSLLTDPNYSGSFSFGGDFIFILSRRVSFEISILGLQSIIQGDPSGLSKGKLLVVPFHFNLQARFPVSEKITPFIEGGAGYYLVRFTIDPSILNRVEEVRNAAGLHLGGGVYFFIQKNLILKTQLGYSLVKTSGTWRLTTVELSGEISDINLSAFIFSTGLVFLL